MRFSRFERKILLAIAAVAVVPLIGALLLGQRALREAYEVGVNPRVGTQLRQGLALYREHFALLKQGAGEVAGSIAGDHVLTLAVAARDSAQARSRLAALLASYPTVVQIELRDGSGRALARVEGSAPQGPDQRRLALERTLAGEPAPGHVLVTVAAPSAPFREYQRAGELVEVYSRLESESALLSGYYLVVYMGFLLSVIVAALAVGVAISRRVTRRVALVAQATAQVGAGDLTVQVPSTSDDEIADLTNAFNAMVRDLRDSRSRIDYLQRISAWQDFARRLAHEIKNPLTPIQLAMQEVHRSYSGSDDVYRRRLQDAAAIVEEEVTTLRRLVSEFSAFAKLPEATLEPADLGDFVRELGRSLAASLHEQPGQRQLPIEIDCSAGPAPLPVEIDAMMLKLAVDNLARNSLQALQNAGRSGGHVWVRAARDREHALLEVSDDGPGVPEATRGRIFDPYYTTKAEGTGLGLAIVKKVVLEHGGEIECVPRSGGGACFRIEIPLRPAVRGRSGSPRSS
ncbi:MAG TPA: ATP-binding protein [Polyangiales bacterium]|nr:ATP-binding protein [Polyangiales bacterium]